MANRYVINLNVSFKDKYQIQSDDGQIISRIHSNNGIDFLNTFLGWLIEIPETFTIQLNNQTLQVKSRFKILGSAFQLFYNQQLIATVTKKRGRSPFSIVVNQQPYQLQLTSNGTYFAISTSGQKILVAKRGEWDLDKYSVVIDDQFDNLVGLGLALAILNGFKH